MYRTSTLDCNRMYTIRNSLGSVEEMAMDIKGQKLEDQLVNKHTYFFELLPYKCQLLRLTYN